MIVLSSISLLTIMEFLKKIRLFSTIKSGPYTEKKRGFN